MSKFLAGAIVLVVALAGCGDSGNGNDKGASAPTTPTKQAYIAKADAICATANKQERAMHPGAIEWHTGPKFENARWLARFTAPIRSSHY